MTIVTPREPTVEQPGTGRVLLPDPNDRNYPLMAVAPRVREAGWEDLPTYRYHRVPTTRLDQNGYSRCVGYSWKQVLLTGPVARKGLSPTPDDIYWWAQDNDPWDGREPTYYGTTVRAGARALVHFKEGTEYRWAFSVEEMVRWLAIGPLVLGIDWFEGMTTPDRNHFIRIAGEGEGGHAIEVSGYNRVDRKFRLPNTWGNEWGDNGFCWMSFETMAELFDRGGEACSLTEMGVTA